MEIEHIITHSIIANQLALNHNDSQNIITIINAYKKDAKSIEGICRKILKWLYICYSRVEATIKNIIKPLLGKRLPPPLIGVYFFK